MVDIAETQESAVIASKEDFIGLLNPYRCLVRESESRVGRDHANGGVGSEDVQKRRVKDLEEGRSRVRRVEKL